MVQDEPPARARMRRRLSDEEIEIWLQVAKTIDKRPGIQLPEPVKNPSKPSIPVDTGRKPARMATAASYSPPASQPRQHQLPLAPLERRLKQKLMRGRSPVDQVLDLHGLYQADAHRSLHQFMSRAQADGARIVLVITGKGRGRQGEGPDSFEPGVLRRLVPHWLRGPEMRSLVIGFEEAGPSHGGSGALFVRVRKRDGTR